MPGVVAVYTGADLDAEQGGIPCAWPVTADPKQPPQRPLLAVDKVNFAGDIVAVVVARSAAEAKDATEAVEVDYDAFDPVLDMEEALAEGATAAAPGPGHERVRHVGCSTPAAAGTGRQRDEAIAAAENDPDSVVVTPPRAASSA